MNDRRGRTIAAGGFMKPPNLGNAITLFALVALLAGCDQEADQSTLQQDPTAKEAALSEEADSRALNANRIALLVTGWGTPLEPVEQYSDQIFVDAIVGRKAASPNEACTQNYVGTHIILCARFVWRGGLSPHDCVDKNLIGILFHRFERSAPSGDQEGNSVGVKGSAIRFLR